MRTPLPVLSLAVFIVTLTGCGKPEVRVKGQVTCGGQPVSGSILFSPNGESADNTGEAIPVTLNPDGTFTATLKTTGKHRVTVNPPTEAVYSTTKPGQKFPCDLKPVEKELKPGDNEIVIGLPDRAK